MAKKTKKYADGGETMSDILSGNFPAARRFKEGYEQMPEALKDPMLGLSVGKAERVLSAGEKAAMEKYAAQSNKTIPKYTQAEKDALAKQLDKNVSKAPIQMYKNRANITGKGLPEETTKELTGELGFKKGGTVKSSSASKRADGCAIRGKTRA
jgi:hypothetical protein